MEREKNNEAWKGKRIMRHGKQAVFHGKGKE